MYGIVWKKNASNEYKAQLISMVQDLSMNILVIETAATLKILMPTIVAIAFDLVILS